MEHRKGVPLQVLGAVELILRVERRLRYWRNRRSWKCLLLLLLLLLFDQVRRELRCAQIIRQTVSTSLDLQLLLNTHMLKH